MHNCSETQRMLIEIAFEENATGQRPSRVEEFSRCEFCSSEYESVRLSLKIVDQSFRATTPDEDFWSDYRQSLRRRLRDSVSAAATNGPSRHRARQLAQSLITASVRVPVLAAAALVLLTTLSVSLAIRARTLAPKTPPPTPNVVTRFVEVPVTHDRVITRIVYRERGQRTAGRWTRKADRDFPNTIASSQAAVVNSLVGFKPTQDVKLTIIKGSYREEK
jgi:hypothetical protein